jgi:hypothetical protein
VDEPEALSFSPGPAATLSRCEPNMYTLFGSPPGQSAMTFGPAPAVQPEVQFCRTTVKPAADSALNT